MVMETNTITKEKRTTNGKKTCRITAVGRRNTDIRRTWVLSVLAILFALCMLMGRTSDVRAEEAETTENENILAVVTEPDGKKYNITNADQLFGEQGKEVEPGSTVTLMQDFTRNGTAIYIKKDIILNTNGYTLDISSLHCDDNSDTEVTIIGNGTDANSRAALILRNSECSLSSMKKLILKNAKIQAAGSLYDINILIPSGCSADITATSLGQENHPGTITVEKGATFVNNINDVTYGTITYLEDEGGSDVPDNDPVTYISNPLTGETETIRQYTEITADDGTLTEWKETEENKGYYVVTGDVTIPDRIKVDGTIHLILTDGCKLTAGQGISVGEDDDFIICGQEKGTGILDTESQEYITAIGNDYQDNEYRYGGNIIINGGEIQAVSWSGAAIGGAYNYQDNIAGCITINGGKVKAVSNGDGAGIGSEAEEMWKEIVINGGEIEACGEDGAGIGEGAEGEIGKLVINGGTIKADSESGAAIGNGNYHGENDSVIIIAGETNISTSSQGIQGVIPIESTGNLIIPADKSVTIREDSTLLNNGTITNEGTFINDGAITNNAVFYNFNEFTRLASDGASYEGNEPIEYLVEEINLMPSTASVNYGQTVEFNAGLIAKGHIPEIEWIVTGANSANTCITVGQDGTALLTVGEDETAKTLTVTVSCSEISDSAVVNVGPPEKEESDKNAGQGSASTGTETEGTGNKEQENGNISQIDETANTAILNRSFTAIWKNKKMRLAWSKVSEADGYDIFIAQSKKAFGKKAAATVTGNKTKAVIKKINGKKLNVKKIYKIKIRAYRTVNGQKQYIGTSRNFYVAGKNSAYTNAKNIRLAAKKITLKKGRKSKIQATVVRQNNKKALLPKSYVANLRYESSNTKVASVTRNGKIKAKKRGTCTITVTAANGIRKQVKVKVK